MALRCRKAAIGRGSPEKGIDRQSEIRESNPVLELWAGVVGACTRLQTDGKIVCNQHPKRPEAAVPDADCSSLVGPSIPAHSGPLVG